MTATATKVTRTRADRIYQASVVVAWNTYLDQTRNQNGARYAEVESWAWARLQQSLKAAQARRKAAA